MKTCKDCKETKPLTEFHKNGPKYFCSYCKSCHVARNRNQSQRTREMKREIRMKEFNICSSCGLDKWNVMEFHHHNDDKEKNCGDIKGFRGWLREARKCIVLCANCHRDLHNPVEAFFE